MKSLQRGVLATLFLALMGHLSIAQHNIKVYITDLDCNDTVRLAYHMNGKQYLIDTATCGNGYFSFKGSQKLLTGTYLVILKNGNYFNFLASEKEDQTQYIFRTDSNFYADGITVEGSAENKVYLDVRKYEALQNAQIEGLKLTAEKTVNVEEKKSIEDKIEQISKNIQLSKEEVRNKVGDLYVGKLYAADIRQEIPSSPDGLTREQSRMFKYMWIRNHYFDNVDFSEKGLIRSTVFPEVLSEFLDKYLPNDVDTATYIVDQLIKQVESEGANEVYQYVLTYLFNRFEKSKRMCYDKIAYHIVSEYYCSGKAYWLSEESRKGACEWVSQKANVQCGVVARDMNLEDTSMINKVRLHDIKTPVTMLVFWDIDCLHCKMELPILQEIYDTLDHNEVTIYAVNINKDFDRWAKVVKDKKYSFINVSNVSGEDDYNDYYRITGTPQIFILNESKEIEYKEITIWDLPKVVDYMVKQQKKN